MAVRERAARAGAEPDLESELVAAELAEQLLHDPRELALGAADEALLRERLICAIGDPARPPDRFELRLVLDGTQLLDEPAARDELVPRIGEDLPVREAEVVLVEAEPLGKVPRQIGQDRARRLDELDALDGLGRRLVAEVREEACALELHEQYRVRALESRQVVEVDGARDQQRLLEPRAQPLEPAHEPPVHRNSRASR
jgi:hypothetical protein